MIALLVFDKLNLIDLSGLNDRDRITVMISILTLIIAILSLIVSVFTLHSQRKTQKNTENIYTYDNILSDIKVLGQSIINNTVIIMSMYISQVNNRNSFNLSPYLFTPCFYDEKLLHSEFFFNKKAIFRLIMLLKQHITEYNTILSLLQNEIRDHSCDQSFLLPRLRVLTGKNLLISKIWTDLFFVYYDNQNKRNSFFILKNGINRANEYDETIMSYLNNLYEETSEVAQRDGMCISDVSADGVPIANVCVFGEHINDSNRFLFNRRIFYIAQFCNEYFGDLNVINQ